MTDTFRYKDIEFRRAGFTDSNGNEVTSSDPEIVAWIAIEDPLYAKETCYTICRLKEGRESWYIETVGERFTEYEFEFDLMLVTRFALRILNLEKRFKDACSVMDD